MSHLVFVESSGSGVNAIDHAKQAGHTVTYLYSPVYDFTGAPQQRALARQLADHTAEIPGRRGPQDVLAALRAAGVRPGEVDAVLSTLAFGVPMAAALADDLGVRGTPTQAIAIARDKGHCREVLRDAGIPSLAFAVVRTEKETLRAAEQIGYPVIVKPVLGVAKAATTIAYSPADVHRHFEELAGELGALAEGIAAHVDERFIVEEFAIGDLCSVEVAADGLSFVPLVTTVQKTGRDNPVLELGATAPAGLGPAAEAELGDYAVRVCRALGLNLGIFHVEVMHTAAGFRLTEANPRIAGGSLPETVNAVADRDMFAILVDLFTGRPVPSEPLRLKAACSHSVLAAADDAMVRADLAPDWFDTFRDRVHSGYAGLKPGGPVRRMRGNFDRFGMFRVVQEDTAAAEAYSVAVKADMERVIGLPLAWEQTQRLARDAGDGS